MAITTASVAAGQTGTIQGSRPIELTTADIDGTLHISTVIQGAGTLNKTGAGTLILSGNNTYTGGTDVDAGALSVNGSITSPVNIGAAGTLMGTGTIFGNVTNSGVLAPGNSIGTLTIDGDYTHNPDAVFQVEVNSAGDSDKLVVTGTATINGGTVSVLAESGSYRINTTYNILTAGSVVGTFDHVTSNLAFLTPSLSYDPANVFLHLKRNTTSFRHVARTGNQRAVGSALDRDSFHAKGDMNNALIALLGLSAPGARGAYDRMGGLSHTALPWGVLSSFRGYMGVMTGRMEGFAQGSSLPELTYRPVMLASRTDTLSDAGNGLLDGTERTGEGQSYGLWARGYGSLGRIKGNDISSRYDHNTAGFLAGFDREIGSSLVIGVSLGFARTRIDMSDLPDSPSVSSYQGAFYGAYRKDPCSTFTPTMCKPHH